jgi:hypothetical protein
VRGDLELTVFPFKAAIIKDLFTKLVTLLLYFTDKLVASEKL